MEDVPTRLPGGEMRGGNPTERLSLRQLAHELNSLLDGSLRYLELARRAASGSDAVATDLECAAEGLRSMSAVLQRAMDRPPALAILRGADPLGVTADRVVTLLAPLASDLDVSVACVVDPAVAGRPAGLLESILVNGMRNAIEAAGATPGRPRRVETSVTERRGDVLVCIADSGAGPDAMPAPGRSGRAGGHGIGLELCRRIVDELGGRMRLVCAPYGQGTVLVVTVPVTALEAGSVAA